MEKIDFEKNSQIATFATLTNTYCLVGPSINRTFYSTFEEVLNIPIIETTINTIKNIGVMCVGNKNGLMVPETCTDSEFLQIRNSLPENVKLVRAEDRFNAFGNTVVCNDHIALVHPDISKETLEIIQDTLGVKTLRFSIGDKPLVGTYSVMNNVGMLVHPFTTSEEIEEIKNLTGLRVIAGSVNKGGDSVGSSILINDHIGFVGTRSTKTEISVMESVFKLTNVDSRKSWVEDFIE
ncbi:Eukaryotic translation initiation factor 6 [Cucumispora dikerogammari]|nr:Eukaryotic translation initiation factor 6 [Cucumispora dikerogammari]